MNCVGIGYGVIIPVVILSNTSGHFKCCIAVCIIVQCYIQGILCIVTSIKIADAHRPSDSDITFAKILDCFRKGDRDIKRTVLRCSRSSDSHTRRCLGILSFRNSTPEAYYNRS